MPITYQQIADKELQDQVRRKHWTSISELKRLNFEEFYFFGETVQALGFSPLGLAGFFGTLIALFNEVAKVEGNLNVSVFNVVMASRKNATYACPFGLGVKFYTSFTDGTCIVSANFDTPAINDGKEKLYKIAVPRTVAAAGMDHQRWVNKLILEGKQLNEHLSFVGYLKLAQQEDSYMLKIKNKTITRDLASTAVSTIVSISLLVGVVYLFLVLASLIQALYPACLIVSEKTPFSRMVLLALGCIAASWILARVQRNMFTINGVGTKLFGRSSSPDLQGYISTKWLTLIIPILPVRSYQIIGEYSNDQDNSYYSMIPLEKLNWAQIKTTIREWMVGYIIFALIPIGLITLLVWKCI